MAKKSNRSSEALEKLMATDFFSYCFMVHNEGIDFTKDEPRYKVTKVHKWLCDTVWKFVTEDTGNPYDIMLLSMPPQHGKSLTITETLPSFYLGHFPEKRVIEASYGEDFAKKFGRANKDKINKYGALFGISVSKDTKSATEWRLSNGIGGMISRGLLSGITGQAGDLIIVDDPIKNSKEAESQTVRNSIWDEWTKTVVSRFQAGTKVIVIQTRWHEDDLIGRLKGKPYVTYYNLEAMCESADDPLGRDIGDALCPEIGKDREWLDAYKAGLTSGDINEEGESGIRAWEALFQGHPTSKEGNILERDWWQYYTGTIEDVDAMIMSVDPAFKDTNDFVAIQVWAKKGVNYYLIDLVKKHLNFQATMDTIIQKKVLFPIDYVIIEDKANGSAIIETLRKKVGGIIAVNPKGSKEERVHSVSFVVEAGNCYLPKDKPFTSEFVEDCSQFPNGRHDDSVDAFSQALARLLWANKRSRTVMQTTSILDNFSFSKPKSGTGKGDKIRVI